MKGDFTRDTFERTLHFSRVLMQQGRVDLDANHNEQTAILLHYLRTLAKDLIGPYGGPDHGFTVGAITLKGDFTIEKGRYYVDGILCENEADVSYLDQPDAPTRALPRPELGLPDLKLAPYLVYLDVWERHVTWVEDDAELIREVALGGPDTASRAKVVWQVKLQNIDGLTKVLGEHAVQPPTTPDCGFFNANWSVIQTNWQPDNRGLLMARAHVDAADACDPCVTPPEARYRGAENQLYRVEVHRGGKAWDGEPSKGTAATFMWSRENGSVVFPVRSLQGSVATVEDLGRDSRFGLNVGDWVEVLDDDYVNATAGSMTGDTASTARPLFAVEKIDPETLEVTLGAADRKASPPPYKDADRHPLLRRWDHARPMGTQSGLTFAEDDGALYVVEDTDKEARAKEGIDRGWFTLEDGVQIRFMPPLQDSNGQHMYRTGDYWLIPARTATGDVEWPKELVTDSNGNPVTDANGDSMRIPASRPPRGVEHHYAPLGFIMADGDTLTITACRCGLNLASKCAEGNW